MPQIQPEITYTGNGSPLFVLAGSSGATQTLTFDVATNELSISGGNTVTLTPTDLFVPGILEIGGTLGVTGTSTLGDGFVSSGTSTVSRLTPGVDAFLKVQNATGEGIGIRANDATGVGSLEVITSGTGSNTPSISLDQTGTVIITKNNIVGAPTTQRPAQQNGVPNATPGSISFAIPTGGVPLLISAAFPVDITHIYRYSFSILNSSTTSTTGEVQIGIYDAAGTSRQIQCFSAPASVLAASAGVGGGYTGVFQPAVASVAFYALNIGGSAAVTIAPGSGVGAAAFSWFIEDLGPA